MFVRGSIFLLAGLALATSHVFAQEHIPAKRDAQSIEILMRVENAAGGVQALSAVRDFTESGEVTFHCGEDVKGPVTIQTLGGNHFRMVADPPKGKSTWAVRDGVGSTKENERVIPLSSENAINLGNLTYPIGHVVAALADSDTDITFVGIEKRQGRSVYRLRVKGQLGLAGPAQKSAPVIKDLLIDALDFDIVGVEDRPFRVRNVERPSNFRPRATAGKPFDSPSRAIEFSDFRVVKGVRVPFSVSTKLLGQLTLSIHLSEVSFNNNLGSQEFRQ